MKKIIFILIILLCVFNVEMAFAANHYIRAGATGNNSGINWTNAWTAIPINLVRGDTYYIASGDYGYGEIIFNDQESGASYIYLKKATAMDHGTEEGWNDVYGSGTAYFGSLRFRRSYYAFDGGGRSGWTSGYGFKLRGTQAAQKLVYFFNGDGNPQPSNIIIRYTEMEHRGRNTETSDDIIYGASGPHHITIQYCYLHDCGRAPILLRATSDFIIEYNWISRNSSSAVNHSCGLSDGYSNNVTIRFNIWEDIEGTSFIETMYGNADNWAIYGNVFFHSSAYGVPPNDEGVSGVIRVLNDSSNNAVATNWKIYNNTIANIKGLWSGFRIDAGSNNYAYNNLWYNCVRTANNILSPYSWYYNTNDEGHTENIEYGTGDPFVNIGMKNFRLKMPTKNGFKLSAPYDKDADGKLRGNDGTWDRGAYEYDEGGTAMRPPSNFRKMN
jgi:hypothetical protein